MSDLFCGIAIAIAFQYAVETYIGKESYLQTKALIWPTTPWWVWAAAIPLLLGLRYLDKRLTLHIPTLEGVMMASDGDWIIRGVKGELYPCKPDIFEETYEPA